MFESTGFSAGPIQAVYREDAGGVQLMSTTLGRHSPASARSIDRAQDGCENRRALPICGQTAACTFREDLAVVIRIVMNPLVHHVGHVQPANVRMLPRSLEIGIGEAGHEPGALRAKPDKLPD